LRFAEEGARVALAAPDPTLLEARTRTLLCGDLFTQGGAGIPR